MTIVIGIDPGLTGAIAAVDGEHLRWIEDMPTIAGDISVALLNKLYDASEYGPWHLDAAGTCTQVAIEHVHSMPGQGVASTFKFGKAYGMMLGYFGGRGHRIHRVAPTEWKTAFRLNGKDKDAARLLAIELWPDQAAVFRRKKDIGRADAALIALWYSRQYQTRVSTLHDELRAVRGGDAA